MKVREVMKKKIVFIKADNSIQEAAQKMKRLNVGNLPVVIINEAVGMLTDRDIVLRVVAPGLDSKETKAAEAMTKGIVVCREDDDLEIAVRMMGSRRVHQLPVINRKGELSGVVSIGDLVDKLDHSVTFENLKTILH